MPDKILLNAQKRTILGRKVKKLRAEGILPANIYGKDIKSLAVQVDLKDFNTVFKTAGETNIVYLSIEKQKGKEKPILIHNVQVDPVSDELLHVDFHQVDLTKKVTADIPLEIKGEAPAVEKGGVLVQLMDEVEVEALPTDLPDKIEVDVSKLAEIGDTIVLKDLKIDTKKVKLTEENLKTVVAQIEEPTKEKEEEKKPEAEVKEGGEPKEGEPPSAKAPEGQGKKPAEEKEAKEGEAKKPEETKESPKSPEKDKEEKK